jgi:phthalate 4,5-cis-dihydrodiol dehydrogenase
MADRPSAHGQRSISAAAKPRLSARFSMTSAKRLRVGVIGLGKAYCFLSSALCEDRRIELIAAADTDERTRRAFQSATNAAVYVDAYQLLNDNNVEAVYIATPPGTHLPLTLAAVAAGKHVLVEKPMSASMAESEAMVEAAERANVQLLVGHTHSYDRPILMARAQIQSGRYGQLRHVTSVNYNNFMTRSRAQDALSPENGGGVVLHQGFHQVDVARLLAGGLVETVTSSLGFWNAKFQQEGAYSAMLRFRSGATATLIYSGYGRFNSDEFCGGVSEIGLAKTDHAPNNKSDHIHGLIEQRGRYHEHFGLVLISCEHADLRPVPEGVIIYCEQGMKFVRAPEVSITRLEVVDELYRAVVNGDTPVHSGKWALATQEVCEFLRMGPAEDGLQRLQRQIEHAALPHGGCPDLTSTHLSTIQKQHQ